MSALIGLSVTLIILLAVYATGHVLGALVFLLTRARARAPIPASTTPTDGVAVLIPARNEGEAAVRVLESLLRQDHHGPVQAYLLIKDADDTSMPMLEAAFPGFAERDPEAELVQLEARGLHSAWVAFTGSDPKSDKVNWMATHLDGPRYAAILDCDHQAHPDWLRSAVGHLHAAGARVIQGRRHPLAAGGLFQLWDSLHQHIGCEVFNVVYTRLGQSVFLTGTTVVLETHLLQHNPLHACITEDTDLSYRLYMQGERIIADPHGGSDEAVSPDLYSFFARRRRWANGHTETFLRHLAQMPGSPLNWAARLQFMFHGAHYLMAAVVFALHLALGGLYAGRLEVSTALCAVGLGLVLGLLGAQTQRAKRRRTWISEVAVLTAWYSPAVIIAFNLAAAWLLDDWTRIALPLPGWIQTVALLGLLSPLVVILAGLAGFGQLTLITGLTVVISYPLAFYLDISGVLIGLMDYIFGRQLWLKVARAAPPHSDDPAADATLAPAISIRESWRPKASLGLAWRALLMATPRWKKPLVLVVWLLILGLLGGGAIYSRMTRVPLVAAPCTALPHDTDPWIVAARKLAGSGYCDATPGPQRYSRRMSDFEVLRDDPLQTVDAAYWDRMDSTFFCNDAQFTPGNVQPLEGGGVQMLLQAEARGERQYTAGSIATKDDPKANFLYGRFETVMKPAKVSGTISAFFLYRFDPWQEIDTEFLGKDTTKIMLNVYYNPGDDGELFNYGQKGTPVLVDLGFDASEAFHHYAVEWDADEIRWFVDDRLIHRRRAQRPTPIPHLPMRAHLNFWPICAKELAGGLDTSALPAVTAFKSVRFSRRVPSALAPILAWYDRLLGDEAEDARWQDDARWIQPPPSRQTDK
jgi:cellulose synthase/poly-beta-1,6-N-acetylglucosamine synthase-like glycosyltransferase